MYFLDFFSFTQVQIHPTVTAIRPKNCAVMNTPNPISFVSELGRVGTGLLVNVVDVDRVIIVEFAVHVFIYLVWGGKWTTVGGIEHFTPFTVEQLLIALCTV